MKMEMTRLFRAHFFKKKLNVITYLPESGKDHMNHSCMLSTLKSILMQFQVQRLMIILMKLSNEFSSTLYECA